MATLITEEEGQVVVTRFESPPSRKVTQLAFNQRFTQAERIMIDLASIDNPAAELSQRQTAAALRDLRLQVNSATFIDLDRPDTRLGVQQLETFGLIGAGRALEILDTAITEEEMYKER